jgi:hypothetical protein
MLFLSMDKPSAVFVMTGGAGKLLGGLTAERVRQLEAAGRLTAIRADGRRLFLVADVLRLARERAASQKTAAPSLDVATPRSVNFRAPKNRNERLANGHPTHPPE